MMTFGIDFRRFSLNQFFCAFDSDLSDIVLLDQRRAVTDHEPHRLDHAPAAESCSARPATSKSLSHSKMSAANLRSGAKLTNVISATTQPNQSIHLIGPVAQPLPLLATYGKVMG